MADGVKFGKTEEGTIWLDSRKISCYACSQFWINAADADGYNFLRYFTVLSVEQIDGIVEEDKKSAGKPSAQGILAREVTRLVHGEEGLAAAERITKGLFSGDLSALSRADFEQLALDGLPTTNSSTPRITLVELLVSSGLASSNKMAREFIANGSVAANGTQITDVAAVIESATALFGSFVLVRRGKKLFHLAVFT